MKENLKPVAYKQSEPDILRDRVTACLLQNEPASYGALSLRLSHPEWRSRSESESEQGEKDSAP